MRHKLLLLAVTVLFAAPFSGQEVAHPRMLAAERCGDGTHYHLKVSLVSQPGEQLFESQFYVFDLVEVAGETQLRVWQHVTMEVADAYPRTQWVGSIACDSSSAEYVILAASGGFNYNISIYEVNRDRPPREPFHWHEGIELADWKMAPASSVRGMLARSPRVEKLSSALVNGKVIMDAEGVEGEVLRLEFDPESGELKHMPIPETEPERRER